MMKRMALILGAILLLLSLAACGRAAQEEDTGGDTSIGGLFWDILHGARGETAKENSQELTLVIKNATGTSFADIGIRWSQNGEVLGSRGMQHADNSPMKDGDTWVFTFLPEELPQGESKGIGFEIYTGLKPGEDYVFCGGVELPKVAFGETYEFELRCEDGSYSLWQVLKDGA